VKLRLAFLSLLVLSSAQAVILYRTGDPNENKTAPTGVGYADSGWQYEGIWGGFLGTPISPHFFISAAHIGNAGGSLFFYEGGTYHVVGQYNDPGTDLVIWEVTETFPTFAPLYYRSDETGQRLIAIGRGTQRGPSITLLGVPKGWNWGPGDGTERWGENIVSSIYAASADAQYLVANFDQNGLPNECHLSVGDSGGAAFILDGTAWKLAGIHYAVDGPFFNDASGTGGFDAAFFDTSGFYIQDGNAIVPASGPSAFYSTRISNRLPWIATTIAQPRAERAGNDLTLTYTKLLLPQRVLAYTVQQSSDLITWTNASSTEQVLSVNGSTQRVQVTVMRGSQSGLFLRLVVTLP
jgi:hypothetical protein